jgi:hypothetical protein
VVLHIGDLQIDEHEATENPVVKYQINAVVRVVHRNSVLPADKSEALAELQEEGLQVIAQQGFEASFRGEIRLRNLQKLEHVWVAEQIARLFDHLPLCRQSQDGILVLAYGEAKEQRAFLLSLELADRPTFGNSLLLVEAAFQRVINLEKFDDMRPAQMVRQRRTIWESNIKLPESDQVTAAEALAVT